MIRVLAAGRAIRAVSVLVQPRGMQPCRDTAQLYNVQGDRVLLRLVACMG